MISGTYLKYLNTLFGFIGDGEIVCVKCATSEGIRDDHGLTPKGVSEGWRLLLGESFGEEDPETDKACPECREMVGEVKRADEWVPGCEECDIEVDTEECELFHRCHRCEKPLVESKEE